LGFDSLTKGERIVASSVTHQAFLWWLRHYLGHKKWICLKQKAGSDLQKGVKPATKVAAKN